MVSDTLWDLEWVFVLSLASTSSYSTMSFTSFYCSSKSFTIYSILTFYNSTQLLKYLMFSLSTNYCNLFFVPSSIKFIVSNFILSSPTSSTLMFLASISISSSIFHNLVLYTACVVICLCVQSNSAFFCS